MALHDLQPRFGHGIEQGGGTGRYRPYGGGMGTAGQGGRALYPLSRVRLPRVPLKEKTRRARCMPLMMRVATLRLVRRLSEEERALVLHWAIMPNMFFRSSMERRR